MKHHSWLALAGVLSCALAGVTCADDAVNNDDGASSNGGGGSGGSSNSGPGPGSSVSSGGSAGVGGGGGMELPTGWVGPVPDLNNDAECLVWGAISPATMPDENGHLYAVRLTPTSYPFTVDEIVYEIFHDGEDCDAAAAQRVELYTDSQVMPPNSPVAPVIINVPAVTLNMPGTRLVTAAVSPPITLQAGEHLFVAVEMLTMGPTCLATCAETEVPAVTDRDWWSNAPMPPYDWETLSSFNLDVHARIGANGM